MKKIIIVIIALLVLSLLYSCKAKIVSVETHKTDTIYKSEIVKITNPQLNEIVLQSPCDSLGNIRPFIFKTTSDKVKTVIEAKDNYIYITQNLDSIKESAVKEYQSKTDTSEIVKVKTVLSEWFWYLLIYSGLATVWIFRKPLLKIVTGL